MLKKDPVFSRGSEREKNFRMCICLIGLVIILYTAVTLLSAFSSLDAVRDYLMRSAFMVEDIPRELERFVK
ncbi:MAG: hypothetical protein IIU77_01815 [Clostridia bacterium]|nr:hypothetical protein [Clostridia bacterium]